MSCAANNVANNAQPELSSDVFGSAATGYTSAMVAVAAMSAAVAAAMLAIVVILVIRYHRRNSPTTLNFLGGGSKENKPAGIYGTLSSIGFSSLTSAYSEDGDDSIAGVLPMGAGGALS